MLRRRSANRLIGADSPQFAAHNPPEILWNFEKFLVSRAGEVVARFAPDVTPDDPRLLTALDAELAKG